QLLTCCPQLVTRVGLRIGLQLLFRLRLHVGPCLRRRLCLLAQCTLLAARRALLSELLPLNGPVDRRRLLNPRRCHAWCVDVRLCHAWLEVRLCHTRLCHAWLCHAWRHLRRCHTRCRHPRGGHLRRCHARRRCEMRCGRPGGGCR